MESMNGKVVIVTGGNTGIGLATVIGLAKLGAHVVMLARSRERGEAALKTAQTQAGRGTITLMLADLSHQADIHRFVGEFQARFNCLDVLVNNAAIIPPERVLTVDGIETQFAVNHLAPFLLTNLLLDMLKSSAPGRILNVASSAHVNGVVELDDLEQAKQYDMPGHPLKGWQAYCNTKLMNVLFTYELARRLEGTDVTVNCLHPGQIATELIRTSPAIFKLFYRMIMPGPERGARTSIYLASSSEVQAVTGQYFDHNQKAVPSSPASHDEAVAQRLWLASEQYTKLSAPSGNQRPVLASV